MIRYTTLFVVAVLCLIFLGLSSVSLWWLSGLLLSVPLLLLGIWDLFQPSHSLLRNYPILAHARWIAEELRPELYQYFVESDLGGRPFNRDIRSLVYERAKDDHDEYPFGTQMDVYEDGYEWFNHSISPSKAAEEPFRIEIGGPQCTQPYSMAMLNVSAMSFGALSNNAIMALNKGAKLGGFAHDTGEGGLTEYHRKHGGDLIWEIGSGYFGCRTEDGNFDLEKFTQKSRDPQVKCVELKLSQGAKPGLGGVMPAEKVTQEIADIRGVPVGVKCVSPPSHKAFKTPRELIQFIQTMRDASGGKPTGFKLCIGQCHEFMAICKAMLELDIYPDFIVVDGGEGGTGAAPLEFENHVGTPLNEALHFVNNALVGCGIRDKIKIGCSGKIASAFDMARRLSQGADFCNAARAMMLALGCIQALRCQTNTCPVGVATQDPKRVRGLVVEDKAQRVYHFQRTTVEALNEIVASLGLEHPNDLEPSLLMRRINATTTKSYADLYHYLEPGELLENVPEDWKCVWEKASADHF